MCDGLDMKIEQHAGMITGNTGNESLVIVALLSNSSQMLQVNDILRTGDIVGRFGAGETWVYRTDSFARKDGILYLLGVSIRRSCMSSVHYFLPPECSSSFHPSSLASIETCSSKLDVAVLDGLFRVFLL